MPGLLRWGLNRVEVLFEVLITARTQPSHPHGIVVVIGVQGLLGLQLIEERGISGLHVCSSTKRFSLGLVLREWDFPDVNGV